MKNIVILVPSLGIGGREKIAINTYNSLKNKYNVYLVVFERLDKEYEFNNKIYCLNAPSLKNKYLRITQQFKRVYRLIKFCKKNKIDCIFSLGETTNITNVLVKQFINVKSIISIHGFAEVYKSKITNFIFRKANKTVCISKDMEYNLLKLFPNLNNTIVIENGYDIKNQLKNRKNKSEFSIEYTKLVSMGRLDKVKGFDRLLLSFSNLVKEYPNAILSIIGIDNSDNEITNLAKDLNIENNVRFLGFINDPYEELIKNDIYVLSSRNEGFPNSLIEALASGLAVVSFDCLSGPREILSKDYSNIPIKDIVYEKYGILVENNNIDLLTKGMLDLIKDKEKVNYYKSIGLERSLYFSLDKYKEKVIKLIENI